MCLHLLKIGGLLLLGLQRFLDVLGGLVGLTF